MNLTITTLNLNVNLPAGMVREIFSKLDQVKLQLDHLKLQGEALMTKATEITQLITQIDEATNEVASDLQALRDQIVGGLSADEAAEVVAKLDASATRLRALGADPTDPVPTPEPDPNAPV